MLKELTTIANEMDRRGLVKEADELDSIIRSYASEAGTTQCWPKGGVAAHKYSEVADYVQDRGNAILDKLKTVWSKLDLDSINLNLTPMDKLALKASRMEAHNPLADAYMEWDEEATDFCSAIYSGGESHGRIVCNWQIFAKQNICFKSEHEFASVIAHEAAHIILRHSIQVGNWKAGITSSMSGGLDEEGNVKPNITPELKKKLGLKPGQEIDLRMALQDNEHKADELGAILAKAAGYTYSSNRWLSSLNRAYGKDPLSTSRSHPPVASRIGGSATNVTSDNVNAPKKP